MDIQFVVGVVFGGLFMAVCFIIQRARFLAAVSLTVEELGESVVRLGTKLDEQMALTEKLRERLNEQKTDKQWMEEYKP